VRTLVHRIASPRLGREHGFSLVEVMVASSIFIIVVAAVISAFVTMLQTSRKSALLQDSQQQARQTEIVLARQLRNLAGPHEGLPEAFDKAGAYDVVFQTVDPNGPNAGLNPTNVERVRYCLDATSRNLYRQVQTWTSQAAPAAPSSNTCPDSGWPSVGGANARVVASSVNNRHNNQTGGDSEDRPVFLYFDSADLTSINTVRVNLWLDVTPGPNSAGNDPAPAETHLESGIFLRNQNRPPTSSFQATTQGNHGLKLNGSASADPEGAQITYTWWVNGSKITSCTGVVCDWNAGASGAYTIRLDTFDPAGLTSTSSQDVQVP
jgi:type II secretory pathway pseudopilin PulG